MRVKITYSEELETIPSLIEKFLAQCGKELLVQSNHVGRIDATTIRDALRATETLENIDIVRQRLMAVDQRLADASSLLSGYNNAIQGKVNDEEEATVD